jgi:PAS domain S-box-containing protein
MPTRPVPAGSTHLSRLSAIIRRDYLLAIAIAAIAVVLLVLGNQVAHQLAALRAAQQDNAQWNLAQLDVELLALDTAAQRANTPGTGKLVELRRRFDVYYSRVNTIRRMSIFTEGLVQKESNESLAFIRSTLEELTPLMDGPDEQLQARIGRLTAAVDLMRPLARQIGIDGVRIYAAQSDENREAFARLLEWTAMVNSALILALGTLLLFLVRQIRISRRRTQEVEAISNRNASTINAALDAIVAVDMDGTIVEFNPAATKIFGFSRNAAVGEKLDELIVPDRYRERHRRGMERYKKTGQKHVIDAGRVEMHALRADRSEFPIELSLGVTPTENGELIIAFLRDISQRVEQEKELRAARDEALEASKAKSQFLAIMSHEMRTPLNGIMAVLDLLSATKLARKQKLFVNTATTSAEILKQHVDDVLDLTRIQAGKLEFFPRAFNLVELLEEVENINLATAAARGNTITLTNDMPQPYFIGDRKRIHQVLTNLVSNAIKFTENGRIAIAAQFKQVSTDVVTIEFSVRDTGIGIAPEQYTRIFEDFVTLDGSYQRNAAGAGLGLPICKNIVEAMDGEIGVVSEPDAGSTFWFRIPLKAAFGAEVAAHAKVRREKANSVGKELKVLVVEDNPTNRFVAGELLRTANCDVALASDGQEGVKLATEKKYDLIFMDLSMPNMNGWDAAKMIRSHSGSLSRNSPIYALTAHALPEELKALHDAGMQGCILKPLRARALEDVLNSLRNVRRYARTVISERPHTPSSVSWAVVNELKAALGDLKFQERLEYFLREIEEGILQLKLMAKTSSVGEIAYLAHKLSGSAAVFGAESLKSQLTELEQAARARQTKLVVESVKQAHLAADATSREFAAFNVLSSVLVVETTDSS